MREQSDLRARKFASPVGDLTVVASDLGVRAVLWASETNGRVRGVDGAFGVAEGEDDIVDRTVSQLDEYFTGRRREFDLPLDPRGTDFQLAAWAVLRTIPFGSTMTYAEQATALGDVNKARAVGSANARNPIGIIVPCHRVVGSGGALTGFAGGIEAKRLLLGLEAR